MKFIFHETGTNLPKSKFIIHKTGTNLLKTKYLKEYEQNIKDGKELYNLVFLGSAESGIDPEILLAINGHTESTYGCKTDFGGYIIRSSIFWNSSKPRYLFSMDEIEAWNPKFKTFAVRFNPDLEYDGITVTIN